MKWSRRRKPWRWRTEQEIAARYGFNVAKALLAQANGSAEDVLKSFLKGVKP